MEFPKIEHIKDKLEQDYRSVWSGPDAKINLIASPYRISPLGAHIDHQGGSVLGMTINSYTVLAFTPTRDGMVRLRSQNYPGLVEFSLSGIPQVPGSFWGSYVRGAALALKEKYSLELGVQGLVSGMLPGCGLSSSASVLLAYLHALAFVNGITLDPWDMVRLTQLAENKHIGLNNGILDQTSIVFGQVKSMVHIDTITPKAEILPDPLDEQGYRILVAYSGYSRELTTTGYNSRVRECKEAAEMLGKLANIPGAAKLGDIPTDVFDKYKDALPGHLQRRALHFFSESSRVKEGVAAWQEGRLRDFGRLMSQSCKSSIEQYECGSQAIHDLHQIVMSEQGVLGSRFSGGGYGGCVVGLVEEEYAGQAAAQVEEAYCSRHPEVANQARVYLASSANGVSPL